MQPPSDQTLILERDIKAMSDRINDNVHRLDRHLEIYAQNGKELAALKVAVSSLSDTIKERHSQQDAVHTSLQKDCDQNTTDIVALQISVSQIAVKTGIYATLGSAAASGIVMYMLTKVLEL
jgi:citrate synthase